MGDIIIDRGIIPECKAARFTEFLPASCRISILAYLYYFIIAHVIVQAACRKAAHVLCLNTEKPGGMRMQDDRESRKALRTLLSALIAEREDSAILYIPHGATGMRRMIRALLELRAPRENDPLAEMIRAFYQGENLR